MHKIRTINIEIEVENQNLGLEINQILSNYLDHSGEDELDKLFQDFDNPAFITAYDNITVDIQINKSDSVLDAFKSQLFAQLRERLKLNNYANQISAQKISDSYFDSTFTSEGFSEETAQSMSALLKKGVTVKSLKNHFFSRLKKFLLTGDSSELTGLNASDLETLTEGIIVEDPVQFTQEMSKLAAVSNYVFFRIINFLTEKQLWLWAKQLSVQLGITESAFSQIYKKILLLLPGFDGQFQKVLLAKLTMSIQKYDSDRFKSELTELSNLIESLNAAPVLIADKTLLTYELIYYLKTDHLFKRFVTDVKEHFPQLSGAIPTKPRKQIHKEIKKAYHSLGYLFQFMEEQDLKPIQELVSPAIIGETDSLVKKSELTKEESDSFIKKREAIDEKTESSAKKRGSIKESTIHDVQYMEFLIDTLIYILKYGQYPFWIKKTENRISALHTEWYQLLTLHTQLVHQYLIKQLNKESIEPGLFIVNFELFLPETIQLALLHAMHDNAKHDLEMLQHYFFKYSDHWHTKGDGHEAINGFFTSGFNSYKLQIIGYLWRILLHAYHFPTVRHAFFSFFYLTLFRYKEPDKIDKKSISILFHDQPEILSYFQDLRKSVNILGRPETYKKILKEDNEEGYLKRQGISSYQLSEEEVPVVSRQEEKDRETYIHHQLARLYVSIIDQVKREELISIEAYKWLENYLFGLNPETRLIFLKKIYSEQESKRLDYSRLLLQIIFGNQSIFSSTPFKPDSNTSEPSETTLHSSLIESNLIDDISSIVSIDKAYSEPIQRSIIKLKGISEPLTSKTALLISEEEMMLLSEYLGFLSQLYFLKIPEFSDRILELSEVFLKLVFKPLFETDIKEVRDLSLHRKLIADTILNSTSHESIIHSYLAEISEKMLHMDLINEIKSGFQQIHSLVKQNQILVMTEISRLLSERAYQPLWKKILTIALAYEYNQDITNLLSHELDNFSKKIISETLQKHKTQKKQRKLKMDKDSLELTDFTDQFYNIELFKKLRSKFRDIVAKEKDLAALRPLDATNVYFNLNDLISFSKNVALQEQTDINIKQMVIAFTAKTEYSLRQVLYYLLDDYFSNDEIPELFKSLDRVYYKVVFVLYELFVQVLAGESLKPSETSEKQERVGESIFEPTQWEMDLKDTNTTHLVNNAGIIICGPYFSTLFQRLDLLDESKKFKDPYSMNRAVFLINYLSYGDINQKEHDLILNNVLCNVPKNFVFDFTTKLSKSEKEMCDSLLQNICDRWEALKNSSPDGLRYNFLMREGSLSFDGSAHKLIVSKKPYDLLVSKIPWTIGTLKLPWMDHFLFTEWQ